ncbi:hypothetical protein ElyMa_002213900 [Elysia marginata]|uniref:Fibronectin type-III domain-containing protein n=1 Tax=Elysia marginata TaxID=1093978 RepID=A0AAV4FTZ6_9GAST|nr:hypothetical protein ElyMa_002213900 [Elysia marginata]
MTPPKSTDFLNYVFGIAVIFIQLQEVVESALSVQWDPLTPIFGHKYLARVTISLGSGDKQYLSNDVEFNCVNKNKVSEASMRTLFPNFGSKKLFYIIMSRLSILRITFYALRAR